MLDASVALAWVLDESESERARPVLEGLRDSRAVVPALWFWEVANALIVSERRNRLEPREREQALALLSALPLEVDRDGFSFAFPRVIDLAREYSLTAYNCAYLELAIRYGLPLATLDEALRGAAGRSGMALFPC